MSRSCNRRRAALLLAGVACAVLTQAAPAQAREQVAAHLVYTANDPAGTCASEAEFRRKVAARLGYDPFRADAPWVFRVRIDARRRPRAEIVTEQRGDATRKRELDDATCEALSETVASTVAIAIDPVAATPGPAPLPAAPSSPSGAGSPGPPPVDPSTSRAAGPQAEPGASAPAGPTPTAAGGERPRIVPSVHLDGIVALGRTAGTALGARGGFALRYQAMSVAGEARGEATPGAVRLTPLDSVYFSVFSAALVPCGHLDIFELCGVLAIGTLQASAKDVTRPSLKGTLFGSLGARLGVGVPITRALALRANAEIGIPLVRTTFSVAGEPVWTAPVVQGTFAIGAEARFR